MKIFKNYRRAEVSVVSKLIITMIVLGLLIYGYKKITDGTTKVLQCKTQGGRCTADTCDYQTEIPILSSKAAGCDRDEICCVSISKDEPNPDAGCEISGKSLGTSCTITLDNSQGVCDWAGKCINKCDFCEKYGLDTASVIRDKTNLICGKSNLNYFNDQGTIYSCSCITSDCSADDYKNGRCLANYCGATNSNVCCSG